MSQNKNEKAVYSRCGMRCDLCLIYRPNVKADDRREEICKVYEKVSPGEYNPKTIICDGCMASHDDAILLDSSCKARKCVLDKRIRHCGYCEEYPCDDFPAEPSYDDLVKNINIESNWTWEDEKLMEAYNCKKNIDTFRKKREEANR